MKSEVHGCGIRTLWRDSWRVCEHNPPHEAYIAQFERNTNVTLTCRVGLSNKERQSELWSVGNEVFVLSIYPVDCEDRNFVDVGVLMFEARAACWD